MRVLLIEDDEDLAVEIAEYLRLHRHETFVCGSVKSARVALEEMLTKGEAPEAIVSDLTLPDGDGAKFYASVVSAMPTCRWILMSGDLDPERIEALSKASTGSLPPIVVNKPLRLGRLRELLEGGGPSVR
jgi:DNA-binding NarL/FixJ family response regulator